MPSPSPSSPSPSLGRHRRHHHWRWRALRRSHRREPEKGPGRQAFPGIERDRVGGRTFQRWSLSMSLSTSSTQAALPSLFAFDAGGVAGAGADRPVIQTAPPAHRAIFQAAQALLKFLEAGKRVDAKVLRATMEAPSAGRTPRGAGCGRTPTRRPRPPRCCSSPSMALPCVANHRVIRRVRPGKGQQASS